MSRGDRISRVFEKRINKYIKTFVNKTDFKFNDKIFMDTQTISVKIKPKSHLCIKIKNFIEINNFVNMYYVIYLTYI